MPVRTFSGQRLRDLRTQRRLTQHDLASELRAQGFGTTQTTISRWEDGQQPQSAVLPCLASALGVEIDDLYGSDDDEESDLLTALDSSLRSYLRRLIREEAQR